MQSNSSIAQHYLFPCRNSSHTHQHRKKHLAHETRPGQASILRLLGYIGARAGFSAVLLSRHMTCHKACGLAFSSCMASKLCSARLDHELR